MGPRPCTGTVSLGWYMLFQHSSVIKSYPSSFHFWNFILLSSEKLAVVEQSTLQPKGLYIGINFIFVRLYNESSGLRITTSLFTGKIPVNLKTVWIFLIVIDSVHASLKSSEKVNLVTTLPGLSQRKFWQVSLEADFKGPKGPLSKGWVSWEEWGGRLNIMTCSVAAFFITEWL